MKKYGILFITILLLIHTVSGQKTWHCTFNFENYLNCYGDTLWIDTVDNANNCWRIGQPDKPIFQSALSLPNAIVTGLDTTYPVKDTSSFVILHKADMLLDYYGYLFLTAYYQVNSDTLTDFGTIEFSPDNGVSWINLMTDTAYLNQGYYTWIPEKPVFSGNSGGWQSFELHITDADHAFNLWYGDTVLFRFTFVSDSVQTFKDGWMLDEIMIDDWYEGVADLPSQTRHISADPNPFSGKAVITASWPMSDASLYAYNIFGQRVREIKNISGTKAVFDSGGLPEGLYILQLVENNVLITTTKIEILGR